ncbi:MAG: alpha/beta hydrolase [Rhodospirillum sp.]|nr:alpha/beta hydrolase [Rhodospirillum sp.]
MPQRAQQPNIGAIAIDTDITLRTMVCHPTASKGSVLLLHGFPETILAWKDIAIALADDYDVHAFDWPGFGLSSRPAVDRFSYAPRDYARVLKDYVDRAGIDRSKLTIYATDIGALPVLLLALEQPDIAKSLIVGDFAPFNRPTYMWENLQALKSKPASDRVRDFMNANRDEILANTFWRGLPEEAHYDVSREFRDDMARSWSHGDLTPVDAFYHYYSHFTRDQEYFESNLAKLATPVTVVWGSEDFYIKKEMGIELADRIQARLKLLPGIGHFPHLQAPSQAIEEIRASFR